MGRKRSLKACCLALFGVVVALPFWASAQPNSKTCLDEPRCRPAIVLPTPGGVIFRGIIDQPAVDAVSRLLKPGDVLFIYSHGGDAEAAIRLGQVLIDRDVTVEIKTDCFSACALYVFTPARHKRTATGADVWFGPPAATWLGNSPAGSAKEKAYLEGVAQAETELYSRAGVSAGIIQCLVRLYLLDGGDEAEVVEGRTSREYPSSAGERRMPRNAAYVAFSPAVLKHFRVPGIKTYWFPANPRAQRSHEEMAGANVIWIDDPSSCS